MFTAYYNVKGVKMDLRTYQNNRKSSNAQDNNAEKIINNTYEKYSNMTEKEMMQAMFDEVNREKRNGVFDINKLRDFYRQISPMLDTGQREKLRGIIESLDD